ncbi:3-deoxy-D-manno-octulosonic acid transferase [Portibacter marinus]|uniref:3-deoxy-D-manno-octulosonic acid transferase n=1 Tax=Portibacter marinus TaxID=2898660 RepID=UPI001F18452C|nr:glycosyltransferase N-terminal domain-containing protein [Portibacter marinus]
MTWRLYQLFVFALQRFMRFHAWISNKSRKGIEGRAVKVSVPKKQHQRVWMHCASLGEFEQGKPVLEKLVEQGFEVVLTFFSPSGYESKKHYDKAVWIGYLPFDTKPNTKLFIEEISPDAAIFVKYEFWWNYVNELIQQYVPTFFISVVLSKNHYLFRWWAKPFLRLLKSVDAIFVADDLSFQLLDHHGFSNIRHSADTRLESVLNRKRQNIRDRVIEDFVGQEKVVIFGSTYPEEHGELAQMTSTVLKDFKILIFPHEIDLSAVYKLSDELGKKGVLYSKSPEALNPKDLHVMIVDRIGLLKDAYRFANVVYIGGGFNKGIHNTLEPLVYKRPLIFGPKYQKFPEARMLATQPFVRVVNTVEEIGPAMLDLASGKEQKQIDKFYHDLFDGVDHISDEIVTAVNNAI